MLFDESCTTRSELLELTLSTKPIEIVAMSLFTQISRGTICGFDGRARSSQRSANGFFLCDTRGQCRLRRFHLRFELLAMRYCLLEIVGDFSNRVIAFLALHLGALASRHCVSLSLFSNCDLCTKLLRAR
jgi:hypothetical protein